jgi:tetratricopeptide (TPR) repeat protein
MSRTAARPLCRALATAIATTILCGCGQSTPVIITPSGERHLPQRPVSFNAPVAIVSRPMEQGPIVLAAFPVEPLPAILDEDRSTVAQAAPAAESPTIAPDSSPADVQDARSPTTSDLDSAYAVAPRRSGNPEDRLAPLSGPSNPTPELIAVARQADVHVGRGFRLAERGALFTARAELRQALALSAAALDEQRNTVAHSRALNNGLRALGEVEDFVPVVRSTGRATRSIETIIQSHQTPILQGEPTDELAASRAIERYLSYAQEQLSAAAGDLQPAASALYALGKLEMSAATDIGSLESARAAVYLQAALIVNPQHALAANELGVLLARHGRLDEAKAALSHTLRIASLPSAWRNLSIVHHGLGEMELAGQADRQWRQAASAQSQPGAASQGSPAVHWVDPATFAQSTQASMDMPAPSKVNQPAVAPPVAPGDAAGTESGRGISSWFPWPRKSR